jgi:hypothetical protein
MNFRAAAVVPVTLVILLALAMLLAPAPCLGALPMVAGFEVSSAPGFEVSSARHPAVRKEQ